MYIHIALIYFRGVPNAGTHTGTCNVRVTNPILQEKPRRDRYNVFAKKTGSQQLASSVGVVSDTATLENLQPGTEYEVSVTYSGLQEKLIYKTLGEHSETLPSIHTHFLLYSRDSVEVLMGSE